MNLENIQPILQGVITGIPLFAAVQDQVRLDDGLQNPAMEQDLKGSGLTLLLFAPMGFAADFSSRGLAWIDYSTTVWLRTNPHVLDAQTGKAKWNPLVCESAIIKAVMAYSRPLPGQFGFHISDHAEPETDFQDVGNFSRLVRFMTRVVFT